MTDIQIKYWSYIEGARHNIATESQAMNDLRETGRHNLITESQGQQSVTENVRHNKATEIIGATQASASMIQADAARTNATTNQWNMVTNAMLSASQIALNKERTEAQKMSNVITQTSLKSTAIAGIYAPWSKLANEAVNSGSTMTKSIFSAVKLGS